MPATASNPTLTSGEVPCLFGASQSAGWTDALVIESVRNEVAHLRGNAAQTAMSSTVVSAACLTLRVVSTARRTSRIRRHNSPRPGRRAVRRGDFP
jgi:hypothetical protein